MADLGVNTSLGVALSEIEKKVGQAEVDRDNLKTNLSNKDMDVAKLNKLSELIAKVNDIRSISIPNYISLSNTWFNMFSPPKPESGVLLAVANEHALYSYSRKGGQGPQAFYNMRLGVITNYPTSGTSRGNIIGVNNEIFAIGEAYAYQDGSIGGVKKFSFVTKTWTKISSISNGLDASLYKLDDNSIVSIGNWVNNNGKIFYINSNSWSSLPNAPNARSMGACCSDDKCIYYLTTEKIHVFDIGSHRYTQEIPYIDKNGTPVSGGFQCDKPLVLKKDIARSASCKANVKTGVCERIDNGQEQIYNITADYDNNNCIFKIGTNGFGVLIE